MNDLTGSKVLIGELLCNTVKDTYFVSIMKFKKLNNQSSVQKMIDFNICGCIGLRVIIVVHKTEVQTKVFNYIICAFFLNIFNEHCWLI
jgi:hypothetical protein